MFPPTAFIISSSLDSFEMSPILSASASPCLALSYLLLDFAL